MSEIHEKDNLKGIIKGFRHEVGVHCTSSAVRNVFEFHGWKMSEAMVFGLGSGMTLAYIKFPRMTPFFGGRNKDFIPDLCKSLNINLNEFTTKNEQEGWNRLKQRLNNNIPSAINIDMGYLMYQTDLADDYHFGGHTIAVCGLNPENNSVYVTDTHFPNILQVSYNELAKGRNSTFDKFMAPNNLIFEFTFPSTLPELSTIIEEILHRTGNYLLSKSGRMLRLMGIHTGVAGINTLTKDLAKWVKLSDEKLKFRCEQQGGFIGTKTVNYGTGGGLFRYLFTEFLQECSNELENEELKTLSSFYQSLGEKWEICADLFFELGTNHTNEEQARIIRTTQTKLQEIRELEEEGARKLLNFKI